MLAGTTDAALAKEEARIRLKREQNEKRKERFFDSRKRLIGVDVDALDAQVAEMQKSKADGKEADRIERAYRIRLSPRSHITSSCLTHSFASRFLSVNHRHPAD